MTKPKPHVLTDKDKTKTVPCTVCGRDCVVTLFAAPAKVRCLDHRERAHSEPETLREFDESKEEHVLTTKKHTKRVPCRVCGRPCVVTTFATPSKVACREHREVARPTRRVTIERTDDGRFEQRTQVLHQSEADLAWSDWVMGQPLIEAVYTDEEVPVRDKLREKQAAATLALREQRHKVMAIEAKLFAGSVMSEDKEEKLEAERSKLESGLESLELAVQQAKDERQRFVRRAWIRTVIGIGYKVRKDDSGWVLSGLHLEPVAVPRDYLDEEDLKEAIA